MSAIPHHTSDPVCALCEIKLQAANPKLVDFAHAAKKIYPDLHISWSYRDQSSQEQAFSEGKTRLHYPKSAHNHVVDGKPLSLAIDIFQIDDSGKPKWDPVFCAKLNDWQKSEGLDLKWGGEWKSLGDNDHFQVEEV